MTFGFFLGPQPRLGLGLGRRFRPKVGFWRCLAISCTCAGQGAAPCSPYRNYSRNPSSFSVNLGFWYTFQVDLICLLGGFRRWCRELQNHMQLSMSIELYFFFFKAKNDQDLPSCESLDFMQIWRHGEWLNFMKYFKMEERRETCWVISSLGNYINNNFFDSINRN